MTLFKVGNRLIDVTKIVYVELNAEDSLSASVKVYLGGRADALTVERAEWDELVGLATASGDGNAPYLVLIPAAG